MQTLVFGKLKVIRIQTLKISKEYNMHIKPAIVLSITLR